MAAIRRCCHVHESAVIEMSFKRSGARISEGALAQTTTLFSACNVGSREFADLCRRLDARPIGYRVLKRLFDLVFSACVIVTCLVPSFALCIAVAAETKAFPIYAQERVGRRGKPFRMYKFRSMVADSENLEKYFTPEQLDTWKNERKVENDPRVTRLGAVRRKLSLDELPQFVNVFLGQISIIGPRVVTRDEIKHYGDQAACVLSVEPGISGAWQCGPRNSATWESGLRQEIELSYVRDASLTLDVQLFIKTVWVMFGKRTGR